MTARCEPWGGLGHDQLGVDALLHLAHVGDHTDHAAVAAQPVQSLEDLFEGLLVEGPETLVHEERVDLLTAGLCSHHIG